MRCELIVFLAADVVVAALIEGIRSSRWGATIVQVAEATGNVSRNYVNRKKGDRSSVLVLCDPTGPVGAHTPDVGCAGFNYSCKGNPTRKGIALSGRGNISFGTARFGKTLATDEPLRVYWAWSVHGDWEAAANSRTDFTFPISLYKLYLVCTNNRTSRGRDFNQDSLDLFLLEFLPQMKTTLSMDPGSHPPVSSITFAV